MEKEKFEQLKSKLIGFMKEFIYPNEQRFMEECEHIARLPGDQWTYPPIVVELTKKSKELGLWNLWLPNDTAEIAGQGYEGAGLTNVQYAELCEIMGTANHMEFAAQCCNCASPDTGNMETLARFANAEQKAKWLKPLLDGQIKSCFAMTEPNAVHGSSDATQISIDIKRVGDKYVINGKKWWITGAGAQECKIMILMGKTDPNASSFKQQSMILVPMDTPGITLIRPMLTIGDAEAPKGHMEILFENVVVPTSNILAGEGRGFEIAQARLGPGRLHHVCRLLGTAERALSTMCKRAESRIMFGKPLKDYDNIMQDIAKSRAEIDQGRMLVHNAAYLLDTIGSKHARKQLSLVKAVIPKMTQTICDRAMQMHGAMGLSQDSMIYTGFVWSRWLRFADGPDEVHLRTVARIELKEQKNTALNLIDIPYYQHNGSIHKKNPPSKL